MQKVNIFWFRRDLRLEDNVGLYYSLKEDIPVLPVFIFDTEILSKLSDQNDARVSFIHARVSLLNKTLREKYEAGIMTFHTSPVEAFEKLIHEYEISAVYTNRDYEPYAKERDLHVQNLLSEKKIQFLSFKDQVIFEQGEILNNEGAPYKVFTPYSKRWKEKRKALHLDNFRSESLLNNLLSIDIPEIIGLKSMGFNNDISIEIPKLEVDVEIVKNYHLDRDVPHKRGTSRLGIHLRFGTISIRQAVKYALSHSETWLNELIWREFYIMILAHFPYVVSGAFKPKYDMVKWLNDEDDFEKWCEGKTGYPIVDAGMRELNSTGFMHNRVRMITASFLTKHLLIDWRWGEAYFASKLLDFELASNNGGWQWAAGTGTDAQPYFRVFNPYNQQAKFDPKFQYIRKWVKEFGTSEYPLPIVDHKQARVRAINTYKEAVS
ncbi:MAG: deoxyribodipyrimidine photo-lyase [Cyclobacteriaceae bacterium]